MDQGDPSRFATGFVEGTATFLVKDLRAKDMWRKGSMTLRASLIIFPITFNYIILLMDVNSFARKERVLDLLSLGNYLPYTR